MEKAKMYFTNKITPESIVKIYDQLGFSLKGKVAVKLHSGEKGNQNYIRPEMVKEIVGLTVPTGISTKKQMIT